MSEPVTIPRSSLPFKNLPSVRPQLDLTSIETIRRVALSDLEQMWPWLLARLQEKFPRATPSSVKGWLRSCMDSREYWFVRTDHAVALARLARLPLEPDPVAIEEFVLAREGQEEAAATLYVGMARWAELADASRLEVARCTDVATADIGLKLGKLHSMPITKFVPIK